MTTDSTSTTIEILGIGFLLAMSVAFMIIFNIAAMTDGQTTVYLNRFGEQLAETIMLNVVVWPTVAVALHRLHRRYVGEL